MSASCRSVSTAAHGEKGDTNPPEVLAPPPDAQNVVLTNSNSIKQPGQPGAAGFSIIGLSNLPDVQTRRQFSPRKRFLITDG